MKHTQREKQQAKRTLHHQLQMSQVRRGDQPRYPHLLWPLRWTIAHSKRMVPLLHRKQIWWQGILPLRTHTPLNEGREPLFPGGEKPRAPKPREDPNRKQTQQGSPKETERPQVGSPRAKPQTRNKNNGEARFRVSEGNNPNQRKTT